MWIGTAASCRELDRLATERYGIPAMVLMERAGLAVFDALNQLLPDGGAITIVSGKGNNGGDGFVVARLAMERGFAIECLVTAKEPELRQECRDQMLQARATGVHPIFCDDARFAHKLLGLAHRDLVIDAILGIGIEGDITGSVDQAVEAINRAGVPVLSVDIPTGIHTETGEELGRSVWALRTVTFGRPKPCLFQGIGMEHSGYWTIADIGIPGELMRMETNARLLDREWAASLIPERLRGSHKGNNGHVLIVAGSHRMRGAAILAAHASLRAGAGLVTVAGIESVCAAVSHACPEATLIPLPEKSGVIAPEGADFILPIQSTIDAALFGPGLTSESYVTEFLNRLWPRWEKPSVVDADALNMVAAGLPLPPAPCVLTPHPGEMGRLLQTTVAEVQFDRFATVRSAVTRFHETVLMKGAYSVIGAPDVPLNVNSTGNPGMATGGMGDILGGMIATLLAQELPTYEAASLGAFWHGAAGDLCAQEYGQVGYTAGDVANKLPIMRAKLLQSCLEDRPPSS